MKFAVFVVLSCLLCVSLAQLTVTTWGNVNGRTLGSENVEVQSSVLQVKTHTFTFPKGNSTYAIYGIKHQDYKSHPVSVKFVKGKLGDRNITLKIESQRGHGIKSTFLFYTN